MIEATGAPLVGAVDIRQLRHFLVSRRRSCGWTQEELAERSGVSVRTIRNIETGSSINPRRASVELLLGAFGNSLAQLAGDSGGGPRRTGPEGLAPRRDGFWAAENGVNPARWRGARPVAEPMVGRREDLRHVSATLQRGRLLMLTGPGGVGKTRLALSAAAQSQALFQDGVAVAELAHCAAESADPAAAREQVRHAVRSVLPPLRAAGGPAELDLLLVLDNAEHVVRTVARLVHELQIAHPGVRVLITSRRALPVTCGDVWEVAPLDVDTWLDAETPPAAVDLFLRRVRSAVPTVNLTNRMPLVVELCRRLEGSPRAVETAAHCIRTVSLESLLRSGSALHMVDQINLSIASRHRSMHESVRWSYDLLGAAERTLLHQLAGSFETFTVEDVLRSRAVPREEEGRLVAGLAELADASLLRVHRGARYEYRLYRAVRDYVRAIDRHAVPPVSDMTAVACSA